MISVNKDFHRDNAFWPQVCYCIKKLTRYGECQNPMWNPTLISDTYILANGWQARKPESGIKIKRMSAHVVLETRQGAWFWEYKFRARMFWINLPESIKNSFCNNNNSNNRTLVNGAHLMPGRWWPSLEVWWNKWPRSGRTSSVYRKALMLFLSTLTYGDWKWLSDGDCNEPKVWPLSLRG